MLLLIFLHRGNDSCCGSETFIGDGWLGIFSYMYPLRDVACVQLVDRACQTLQIQVFARGCIAHM